MYILGINYDDDTPISQGLVWELYEITYGYNIRYSSKNHLFSAFQVPCLEFVLYIFQEQVVGGGIGGREEWGKVKWKYMYVCKKY